MKKNNPKDSGVKIPFEDIDFINKWQEWLQYRKERRLAAYAPTGLKRTFAAIVRDSENDAKTAVLMIDQAMEKSWQGIYPLKTVKNGTKSTVNDDKLKATITAHINGW